jgi:prephenate dehydrogenase
MSFEDLQRWDQVTVIGCGLIGSSFALALRQHNRCERVLGWDTSGAVLNQAIALGIIDDVDPAFSDGGVSRADLLYLAMPVLSIVDFLTERTSQTRSGAIITDAGSTKREICRAARQHLPSDRHFIGGHPVAGSHAAGPKNASAELLAGSNYVIIEDDTVDTMALGQLEQTIKVIGARPKRMTATEHDRTFALVSHLPQLLSSALASVVENQADSGSLLEVAGPGYKDMTRLADSSWSIWSDVLATNRAEISSAFDQIIDKLSSIREELHQEDLLNGSTLPTLFRQRR